MKDEAYKLIAEWIYHNNKLREINQYLFNQPELFEEKYCQDFNEEIFRFFSGKLNRYARDYNTLVNTMDGNQLKKLNYYKLFVK